MNIALTSNPVSNKEKATKQSRALYCADFFAGSGLATEALSSSFMTVWANDICSKKAETFKANHDESIFHLDSIESINGSSIPEHDLSWASFPCQDLSLAGKNSGITGKRSGMVWEWLRILKEQPELPKALVAENVKGLVSTDNGSNYILLHNALSSLGYKVGAVLVDAIHWLPQSRQRVFVIAIRDDISISHFMADKPNWSHPKVIQEVASKVDHWHWWNIPEPTHSQISLESIIDTNLPFDSEEIVERNLSLIPDSHWEKMYEGIKSGLAIFPGYKRTRKGKQVLEVRADGIAGCLRTPAGGSSRQQLVIFRDGKFGTRLPTIKETALLMGAAEDYSIIGSYNEGYKAMGDAIAVPVVQHITSNFVANILRQ